MNGLESPFDQPINTRPPLLTPGGAVSIAAAAETEISEKETTRFGYLLQIDATCTIAASAAGTWTLRDAIAGGTLLVLQQANAAAAPGDRLVFCFPHPWKNSLVNEQFTIEPSAATLGTWIFTVNGFYSST